MVRLFAYQKRRFLHNVHNHWAGVTKAATYQQDEVAYTDEWGDPETYCSTCVMFVWPEACTLVKGIISPFGHCERWYPRHQNTVAKAHDHIVDDAIDEPMAEHIQQLLRQAIVNAAHQTAVGTVNQLTSVVQPIRKAAKLWDPAELAGASLAKARDYAEDRVADLVTGINDTTRDILKSEVSRAIAGNWDVDTLADRIADTGVFSDYRAEMIARTETNAAQNWGTLAAGREASNAGVKMLKSWSLGPDPCPACEEAAAEGEIELDDEFGDAGDAPPLHPNCQCELDLVVAGDSDEDEE